MNKSIYLNYFNIHKYFLYNNKADNDDQNTKPEFNLGRTIHGCIAKFNVTDEQMTAVMKTGDARAITPCFWSCCFKGAGVVSVLSTSFYVVKLVSH